MEKESTAREQVETLGAEVPDLLEEFNTKKGEREEQFTFLKDEAGLEDVAEYDPAEGPPELPEEEDAATTGDDGSGDAADGATTGDDSATTGDDSAATGGDWSLWVNPWRLNKYISEGNTSHIITFW